jgi:pimeloyl-ACP methyl ester carboxylesterase
VTLAGNPAVEGLIRDLNDMGETIDPAFVRAFQESTVSTPLPPLYLDLVVAESLKVPPHVWRAAFMTMASEKPDPAKIACRTLLIGCAKDEFFTDRDRRALAAAFSNEEEILYPDLGHAPHWEQPARVARDIAEFIG